MQLGGLLLASLPAAALAALAYTPPPALLSKAQDTSNDCILPAKYHIHDFVAMSDTTGPTLSEYSFSYLESATKLSTICHYDRGSVSTGPPDLAPRYSCRNRDIRFIWQDSKMSLLMIQRVCPGTNGIPAYEVSGSVIIPLVCDGANGNCVANQTDFTAPFTSLQPVRDSTAIRL